jgi:ABC-type Fe3+-citrate transport system substrate-binding protein
MSLSERMKILYKKYGKVAISFHLAVWAATFAAMYGIVEKGIDANKILRKLGMKKQTEKIEQGEQLDLVKEKLAKLDPNATTFQKYWFHMKNSETFHKAVLAFALLKLTGPFRTILTLAATPAIAKALAKRGLVKLVK